MLCFCQNCHAPTKQKEEKIQRKINTETCKFCSPERKRDIYFKMGLIKLDDYKESKNLLKTFMLK